MLLIFTEKSTIRLQYICKFIFDEILCTSYAITIDENTFIKEEGNKINYSSQKIENVFQIVPQRILFESTINAQTIECFNFENEKAFFKTNGTNYPFDIFAACFYLITRYEEYLPHAKDMYGRYAHQNSIAHKQNFLNKPLINIWAAEFKKTLQLHFPTMQFAKKEFSYLPTYDIDMAWAYKEKGFLRNTGGFVKSPSIRRITALLGFDYDPFDCYNTLDFLHKGFELNPIYFFLMAKENSIYDKNILPENKSMQKLIKRHSEKYTIGIHPSWKSFDDVNLLKEEKKTLEYIASLKIIKSRQHYLKFELPETYNRLIKNEIIDDYSMGYGTINGFRASTSSSFLWFDLAQNNITKLRIHPFCFMDANSFYEQKFSADEAYAEMMYYYNLCKNLNMPFITIFHNSILGTNKEFNGWASMYQNFLNTIFAI